MAIRTDELAFGYLIEDLLARAPSEVRADVAELECSEQVIPLHDLGPKYPPAVGTRPAVFQAE